MNLYAGRVAVDIMKPTNREATMTSIGLAKLEPKPPLWYNTGDPDRTQNSLDDKSKQSLE